MPRILAACSRFPWTAARVSSIAFFSNWARFIPARVMAVDWPPPPAIVKALTLARARVELTEIKTLMIGRQNQIAALEAAGVRPLTAPIRPANWDKAQDQFLGALRSYAIQAHIVHMPAFGDLL